MKKAIIDIGVLALILGTLLVSLPLVYIPSHISEAYQIPESQWVTGMWLWYPPVPTNSLAEQAYLNASESLNIQVNATPGKNINFFVNDGSTTYLSYSNVTALNKDWIVPKNSTYNFVFNSSSSFTDLDVSWQVTRQRNETAYRSVTQNVPLLPFQVLYVGVAAALSGMAITVYGIRTKKERIAGTLFSSSGVPTLYLSQETLTKANWSLSQGILTNALLSFICAKNLLKRCMT